MTASGKKQLTDSNDESRPLDGSGRTSFDLPGRGNLPATIVFSLAVLMAVTLTTCGFLATKTHTAASQHRDHAHRILGRLDRLQILLQEAESGQRGYLLTSHPQYLAPYTKARAEVDAALIELRKLDRAATGLELKLEQVENLVRAKFDDLHETLEAHRLKGDRAAQSIVQTHRGQAVMDELRRRIAAEQSRVRQVLDTGTELGDSSGRLAHTAWGLGGVSGIGLAVAFWIWLRRERARRLVLEKQLAASLARHAAAEQTFRNADTLQRAILDSTTYAIVSTDTKGVVTTFNAGASRLLGYAAAEVCGRQTPMIWHTPEELALRSEKVGREAGRPMQNAFEAVVWNAHHGRADETEWTFIRKDGSRFPAMLSVTALRAPGGDVVGYLGVFSDMTGRKRIEAQLNHSRERFELATRGAVDGIWDWNVRTGYFYLSDRWFELLGYKHGELPPKLDTWHAQLHPDEREAVVNAMLAHLDRRVPYDIECRVRAKDGSYRWFRACGQASWDSAGVPQRMAGSLTDITERRLADEKLRFSEERFRNAVEYSAIGIALVGLDGRWLQVNRAICSMLGYTAKELLALTFQDITHPDDLKTDLTYVDDMLSGRISTYQMEKRYVRKNGVLVWALLNVSLVRGTAGEPVHFVSQVQDITARKHAELQRVALLGVTVALAESTSLEESALRILQSVCTHLSWDFGAVWKVTSEESPLRCVALWPGGDKNLAGFEAATRSITFRRGAGLPGRIWKSGRTCWIDDLASDRNFPRAAVAAAAGLHAGCGFPIIVGGEVRGVVEFFSHEVRERDTASEELFASIGVQIGQIMERWHAGEQLAANEALLRQFVRHTPAAVAMLDTSLRYLQASDNWIRDYHLDGRPVLGRSHYEVFPDIPERWKEIHRRVLAGAVERCDEDPYERADGTLEWLQWEARPWHKAGGEIGGLIFFTQVITERKRAEQALRESLAEKEILLKEIHHRVKNNMQVISSMLSLQAGYIEDPRMRALFADCQDRVQCMAMIHEKLYRAHNLATIDFGVHIRDLADMLFRSHAIPAGLGDVRLEIEADPVTLDIDTSIPAGLILNELLTNALKHAFPDQKAGVVRVTLKRTPPDMLLLTVTDNGVGLPSGLEEGLNRSMGLKMIRSLTRQIGGTLDVHRESGAGFRIRFPAPPSARLRVGPTPEMPSAPT